MTKLPQECSRTQVRTRSLLKPQKIVRTQKERLSLRVYSHLRRAIRMQKLMRPCHSLELSSFHQILGVDQSDSFDMYLQKQTCYISLSQKRNGLVCLWAWNHLEILLSWTCKWSHQIHQENLKSCFPNSCLHKDRPCFCSLRVKNLRGYLKVYFQF